MLLLVLVLCPATVLQYVVPVICPGPSRARVPLAFFLPFLTLECNSSLITTPLPLSEPKGIILQPGLKDFRTQNLHICIKAVVFPLQGFSEACDNV